MAGSFTAAAERWARLWGLPDLATKTTIEFSPRLRTSLGRCLPARGTIRLHPALRDAPPDLRDEVLCHELAHLAAHRLHGPGIRAHGREWRRLMQQAGFAPRARMPRPAGLKLAPRRPTVLYHHRCPVCGAGRTARRPVRAWRCRDCFEAGLDGVLEIYGLGPVRASRG